MIRRFSSWLAGLGVTALLSFGELMPSAQAAPAESPPGSAREAPVAEPKADPPAERSESAEPPLTPPSLIRDAQPTYPREAEAAGIAAEVVLDIDVSVAGTVENAVVTVPASTPGYGFDEAALEAAKQLVFEPARVGEQAVPVRISYRFRFVPRKATEATAPTPAPPKDVPTNAAAEAKGELTGSLRERGTRLPLAGVTVTAFRGEGKAAVGYETETDKAGHFQFKSLTAGRWRLLADPVGYYPLRTTEEVAVGTRTAVDYVIERQSYNPYDVVVETDRVQREVSRTTIDARQADRIPGTFGDVLNVVQNFPGVARSSFGQSEVVIRGASQGDSRFLVSGIEVPLIYHFFALRSILPVGMIERIDFYPGNYSVEFGRATGGVIDVQLRELSREKFGGYVDLSLVDGSLYLEVPVTDDFSLAVAGRRSWVGDVLGLALAEQAQAVVAPRYYDAQFLASYRPNSAHRLRAFFFLSDDRFDVVLDEPEDETPGFIFSDAGVSTTFYRALVEHRYVPNPRFQNELKLSYGRDSGNFNVGQDLFADFVSDAVQVRNTARYEFSKPWALRGGLDYRGERVDAIIRFPQVVNEGQVPERLDSDDFIPATFGETIHATGAFAELEIRPRPGTLILPGLRLDHFSKSRALRLSPRLTTRQALGQQWTLKGGVGLFVQETSLNETNDSLGNPDLDPESAIHYSLGVEYRPWNQLLLDVTGFYKTLYDVVGATDAVTERNGETVPLRYSNESEGRVVGLEVSARHELFHDFFGWIAYTLSRSERKDAGADSFRLFDSDQTHIFTALGSYRLPRNWEISGRFRYVTGNPFTPFTASVYNASADAYEGIPGAINSAREPAFHQLDFRIDKRWIFDSWILNAYLDIQNVYDHANPEEVGYNFDFSEQQIATGLPIFPVLGLRGDF